MITYGASNIMAYGSIFEKWRGFVGADKDEPTSFFGKLFGCMMCLPFWWGVILSLTIYSPSLTMLGDATLTLFNYDIPSEYLAVFFDGCLASGTVWFIHTFQEYLEQ